MIDISVFLIEFDGKPTGKIPTYRELVELKDTNDIHPWHRCPSPESAHEYMVPVFRAIDFNIIRMVDPEYLGADGSFRLIPLPIPYSKHNKEYDELDSVYVRPDSAASLHYGWFSSTDGIITADGQKTSPKMEAGMAFAWALGKTKIVRYRYDGGEEYGTGFLIPSMIHPETFTVEAISGDGDRQTISPDTEVEVIGYLEVDYR